MVEGGGPCNVSATNVPATAENQGVEIGPKTNRILCSEMLGRNSHLMSLTTSWWDMVETSEPFT